MRKAAARRKRAKTGIEKRIQERNRIILELYRNGLQQKEIAKRFGISKQRVKQIIDELAPGITTDPKLATLRRLRSFILRHKPKITDPEKLERFLRENCTKYSLEKLARELNASGDAIRNLLKALGLLEQAREEKARRRELRKQEMRKEVIAWAKRQPRENLSYGFLFKNNPDMLYRILYAFSESKEEFNRNKAKVYERFLNALGLSRKDVGMTRPKRKLNKEELREKILAYISKAPRKVDSLYYPSRSRTAVARGFASSYVVLPILKELREKGLIKETKILGRKYYYVPGQEERIEKLRERAVRLALNLLYEEKAKPTFGPKDIKAMVALLLDKPKRIEDIIKLKTKSGKIASLCSYPAAIKAVKALISEGKVAREVRGRKVYYRRVNKL